MGPMTKQEIDDARAEIAKLGARAGFANTTFRQDDRILGVSTTYKDEEYELTFVVTGDDAKDRVALKMAVQSMADLPERVADEG